MITHRTGGALIATLIIVLSLAAAQAADSSRYKADVPQGLLTPDKVQTEKPGSINPGCPATSSW